MRRCGREAGYGSAVRKAVCFRVSGKLRWGEEGVTKGVMAEGGRRGVACLCCFVLVCVCACRSRKERGVSRAGSCAEDDRRTAVASSIKDYWRLQQKVRECENSARGSCACVIVGGAWGCMSGVRSACVEYEGGVGGVCYRDEERR